MNPVSGNACVCRFLNLPREVPLAPLPLLRDTPYDGSVERSNGRCRFPCFEVAAHGPLQTEVLTQRTAFILGAENAALLQ
ncbi:hypothetical protein SAMN02787142_4475 [Burkholderia sp. WP9]|nr:hypothetical protein SAMN02787142_4475 [Burkholderia sp. WP9]